LIGERVADPTHGVRAITLFLEGVANHFPLHCFRGLAGELPEKLIGNGLPLLAFFLPLRGAGAVINRRKELMRTGLLAFDRRPGLLRFPLVKVPARWIGGGPVPEE